MHSIEAQLLEDLNVSRETLQNLHIYIDILLHWNNKINLVSNNINRDVLIRDHLLDSAQIFKFIEDKNATIVDVGSGAGFPGIVLSILGCNNCNLVEIITKKAVFLKTVATQLKLSAKIHNEDIYKAQIPDVDFIVSRAVTSVLDLVEMSKHLVNDKTKLLLLKSKSQKKELIELEKKWNFKLQEFQNIYKTEGVVLLIQNLSEK